MKKSRSTLTAAIFTEDLEFFKKIQHQYKAEDKTVATLFMDLMQAFKEKNNIE